MSCCCSEICKEQNIILSKAGSEVILKTLLGRESEIDVDALPMGPEDSLPEGFDTVCAADEVRAGSGKHVEILEIQRDTKAPTQSALGGNKKEMKDIFTVKLERSD